MKIWGTQVYRGSYDMYKKWMIYCGRLSFSPLFLCSNIIYSSSCPSGILYISISCFSVCLYDLFSQLIFNRYVMSKSLYFGTWAITMRRAYHNSLLVPEYIKAHGTELKYIYNLDWSLAKSSLDLLNPSLVKHHETYSTFSYILSRNKCSFL